MRTKMIKARDVAIGQEYWHSPLDTRFTRVGVNAVIYGSDSVKEVVCLAKGSFNLSYTQPDSIVAIEVPSRFIRDIPAGEKFTYGGNEYVKMNPYGHKIDGSDCRIIAMRIIDSVLYTFSGDNKEE